MSDFEAALDGVDDGRKAFLHRLTSSPYDQPTVSSFSMGDISTAYAGVIASLGPNQSF